MIQQVGLRAKDELASPTSPSPQNPDISVENKMIEQIQVNCTSLYYSE